jgi:tetratricopeptide (TPR) repeat protein
MRTERILTIAPETPPTPEETEQVLQAYGAVIDRYGLPTGESAQDTVYRNTMGRILSTAQMGMVRMYRIRGDAEQARQILESAYDAYPWDFDVTLQLHQELIAEMLALRDPEEAARINQQMASTLAGRTPDGEAVMLVLNAPVRAADLLLEAGKREEAEVELDRAEIYYREVIDENPADEAASIAMVNLGTVAMRRGRYDEAATLLDEAAQSPGAESLQARILFLLGTLHQEGLGDLEAAASIFERIVSTYPTDEFTSEAMGHWAVCLSGLGRRAEAIEVLDRIEEEFPREREKCASAHLLAARILSQDGRWQEALARYRLLQAAYGTSPEAITAHFEIAAHYREAGELEAERSELENALGQYDRIARERPGTSEARLADVAAAHALGLLDRWTEASDRLLRMASSYPSGRHTAAAMLEAAAIIAERLDDPEGAAEVLERLAATYPDSPLAAEALRQASKFRGQ